MNSYGVSKRGVIKGEGGKPGQNGVSDPRGRGGLKGKGEVSIVFWVGR